MEKPVVRQTAWLSAAFDRRPKSSAGTAPPKSGGENHEQHESHNQECRHGGEHNAGFEPQASPQSPTHHVEDHGKADRSHDGQRRQHADRRWVVDQPREADRARLNVEAGVGKPGNGVKHRPPDRVVHRGVAANSKKQQHRAHDLQEERKKADPPDQALQAAGFTATDVLAEHQAFAGGRPPAGQGKDDDGAHDKAQGANLNQRQDHNLAEQRPVIVGRYDRQTGDAHGRRRGEKGHQEIRLTALGQRERQHQQPRTHQDQACEGSDEDQARPERTATHQSRVHAQADGDPLRNADHAVARP